FLPAFEVCSLLADDDSQLDLPVELLCPRRDADRIVRAGDRVRGLEEDDGLFGCRVTGLGRMLDVVLSDADHRGRAGDRGTEALALDIDFRQTSRLEGLRHTCGTVGPERRVDITDNAADVEVVVSDTNDGRLLIACADSHELH